MNPTIHGKRSRRDLQQSKIANLTVIRIVAWCLAATIIVLSVVPPRLRPETVVPHGLEHFIIYLVDGAAFGLGYYRKRGLLAIQLVVFAGFVEVLQLFVPGRHARLGDFIVDALAACLGLLAASVISNLRARL